MSLFMKSHNHLLQKKKKQREVIDNLVKPCQLSMIVVFKASKALVASSNHLNPSFFKSLVKEGFVINHPNKFITNFRRQRNPILNLLIFLEIGHC